jgi:hypothetical protein
MKNKFGPRLRFCGSKNSKDFDKHHVQKKSFNFFPYMRFLLSYESRCHSRRLFEASKLYERFVRFFEVFVVYIRVFLRTSEISQK